MRTKSSRHLGKSFVASQTTTNAAPLGACNYSRIAFIMQNAFPFKKGRRSQNF